MEESSLIVAAIVVIILPAVIFGAVLKSYKGAFIVGFLLLLLLFLQIPTGLYVFFLLIILPFFAVLLRADKKIAAMPLAERQRYLDERRASPLTLGHGSLICYILLLLLVWVQLYSLRSAKTREDHREGKIGSARPTAAGYVYEEYNLEKYVREMSCTPLSKADCGERKREILWCGQYGSQHCDSVNDREFLRCVDSRDRSTTIFDCMKFSRRKSDKCYEEWSKRCGSR